MWLSSCRRNMDNCNLTWVVFFLVAQLNYIWETTFFCEQIILTITAFHKGGSIGTFMVRHADFVTFVIYHLKEKSDCVLLFNLYVWFYFLCVIKRKIVAAISQCSKAKRINGIAISSRVYALTQTQIFIQRCMH